MGHRSGTGIARQSALASVVVALLGLTFANAGSSEDSPGTPDAFSSPPGSLEFVGKNLFSTAKGRFHRWRVVEQVVEPGLGPDSWALVEVDLASVDTGIDGRDDHLRDPDFFEVETYPVARARMHSPKSTGESEEGHPRFEASFDIDLHGVSRTLLGEIVRTSESPLVFEGSLVLDRMDFAVGPPPSRWNPMAVKAEIPVRFRIEVPSGGAGEGGS